MGGERTEFGGSVFMLTPAVVPLSSEVGPQRKSKNLSKQQQKSLFKRFNKCRVKSKFSLQPL